MYSKRNLLALLVLGRTLSAVCGINQNEGETGDKNTTQMIRIVIKKQEGYPVLSLLRR